MISSYRTTSIHSMQVRRDDFKIISKKNTTMIFFMVVQVATIQKKILEGIHGSRFQNEF